MQIRGSIIASGILRPKKNAKIDTQLQVEYILSEIAVFFTQVALFSL